MDDFKLVPPLDNDNEKRKKSPRSSVLKLKFMLFSLLQAYIKYLVRPDMGAR